MSPRRRVRLFDARPEQVSARICRLGFRRWHERELIAGHGWLVVTVVAMILVAAGLELLTMREGLVEFLGDAFLIGGSGLLAFYGWGRYRDAIQLAGAVSDQAVCAGCGHFGFRAREAHGASLRAHCPKCDHQWWVSADRELDQVRS